MDEVTKEYIIKFAQDLSFAVQEIRQLLKRSNRTFLTSEVRLKFYKTSRACNIIISFLAGQGDLNFFYFDKRFGEVDTEWTNIKILLVEHGLDDEVGTMINKTLDMTTSFLKNLYDNLVNIGKNKRKELNRWANVEEEKNRVTELEERIKKANEELKNSKKNNTVQKENIEALNQEKAELQKIIAQYDAEAHKQKAYEDKITETFQELNGHIDILEKEECRIQIEYYICNVILVVLVALVVLWFGYFLSHATGNVFIFNWYTQLAPWYTPIPFFAAFFWVIIVLRNRANRTLLTIRKDIFKIRYSEGLIKSISRLSDTFENGMKRVTDILDDMVKSYEHQIETSFVEESKKIERDTPVDASDISQITDTLSGLIEQVKGLTKSK